MQPPATLSAEIDAEKQERTAVGDWFQVIADVDATADEAEALGAATLAWLVDTGVVLGEATDCVLANVGYPPGPRYATAVTEVDPRLLTLRTNGVEVITGRTVFYSMGADHVTCPHCRHVIVLADDRADSIDPWRELSAIIEAWRDGDTGDYRCPTCRRVVGLNDWTWSPPWAFGYVGFKFWNWPQLTPNFLADVSTRLGHRTVHPHGKM
jgi:DNA-directed RNA polymerase subunit RPC12/RpoP